MPRTPPLAENGMLRASRALRPRPARRSRPPTSALFTHKHPYPPGLVLADQNPLTVGAYHTADVPYWFGTLRERSAFSVDASVG